MEQYKKFLAIWQCVNTLNKCGVYVYGYATANDGNYKIEFTSDSEKDNYTAVFSGND